ncbi:oxidoreductase/nitrogenase component 1 [Syntrophobotulus glycolicus DSM 8271]|uniref:Oxidoreductase/nitrogenase component 1 n=1 Tax=Syntrophobotulus glycolicus (strain DSM 8271 / FlGlyR) TaxID=645991 RepID=F0STP6_SYNGF|nr:nitrogenase component 1 [Syntrophobotulus glycolicus]ADY55336.1 oxidoreductase/nitrogenase component 1 [Syntrophobotulus glycolicus DSM 8271]
MAINLNVSAVGTREERLGSVVGYVGDIKDLARQSRCGTLKDQERCFSQSSTCDNGCAVHYLAHIRDVAVIIHAPSGCAALASASVTMHTQLADKRGLEYHSVILGTDMNESDTVFGAVDGLRDIVVQTYERYKPSAVFVATSCVSGIIGEDVDSVVEELDRELPVPVVAMHCEGFKSKVWATGFDAADHAILRGIVKPPREKRNVINFKNFNELARREITEMFANFGVTPFFLYSNTTVEELSHISEALATVSICGTLSSYLGNALEQEYGVPYIKTINPLGVAGFEIWLREIGRVIGKENEVEAYIQEQRQIYLPQLEEVKKKLKGLRVVLGMGSSFAFQVARVIQELDMEVAYIASWHYDSRYDDGEAPPHVQYLAEHTPDNFKVSVADQQNFEILNILNTYKPDLYLARHGGTTVWAIKQGTPSIFMADEYMTYGYKGTLDFAYKILAAITNRSFEKNLSSRIELPYTSWWYEQDSSLLYKKEEVEANAQDT